jgi:phospholipid N-methyltransferase
MIEKTPRRGAVRKRSRGSPGGGSILRFGRAFVKEPAMLGSVIPSSRYLVRRTLKPIDWARADVVVEYGPGVGTITGEILRHLRSDARLLVFETHDDFVRHLREAFPDPRLEVIHGSAEDVARVLGERDLDGADYVLSGIPFSLMPDDVRDQILVATRDVLEPEGAMLVYQFSPTIGTHLKRVFSDVSWEFEPRNFLPATVFCCRGSGGSSERAREAG